MQVCGVMPDEPSRTMKNAILLSAALALAIPAGAQAPAPVDSATASSSPVEERLDSLVVLRQLKFRSYYQPSFSAMLTFIVVTEGRVEVAVQVDTEGKPTDSIILAYSHRELANSTLEAVHHWRFEPELVEGHPVPAQCTFSLEFRGPDVVTISPIMDQREFFFRSAGIERLEYRPCPLNELDRIPIPLNVVAPRYSTVARDLGVKGNVEVLFYLDEKGNVRLPAILNADRVDLALEALDAVRQWKFEPPTRNGRPVLIAAVQQFNFGTGAETAANGVK